MKAQEKSLALTGATLLGLLITPLSSSAIEPADSPGDAIGSSPGVVVSGNETIKLTVSGQVNRGLLFFDDGEESGAIHVDNDNSSTRIRLLGELPQTGRVRVGTTIEVQFESNSTAAVDQDNQRNVGPNSFTERKLEAYADIAGIGKVTVGQGETATDGTSEVDLSGTSVIGYSGVADLAGGLRFRDNSGALSDLSVGESFSNLDGLSRDDRLRYDSPNLGGLRAAVSTIADDRWDAALYYQGSLGGFQTGAAIAYADPSDAIESRVNGSVSVLHSSGFSVTVAAGEDDRDDQDPRFAYLKVGLQGNWSSYGVSAVSIDVYEGEGMGTDGDSSSVGIQFVQNLDRFATELYAGVRNYELDGTADDILASLVGARIKF